MNWMPTTPTSSEAVAETVMGPETVAPGLGEVMLTVGAVVSLKTTTLTGLEVNRSPSASRATAVKVWAPLLVVVVSQGTEYGAVVSSAPRSTPSRLNWTLATRAPTGLMLALTVIVLPTVEPGAGEVIVTT